MVHSPRGGRGSNQYMTKGVSTQSIEDAQSYQALQGLYSHTPAEARQSYESYRRLSDEHKRLVMAALDPEVPDRDLEANRRSVAAFQDDLIAQHPDLLGMAAIAASQHRAQSEAMGIISDMLEYCDVVEQALMGEPYSDEDMVSAIQAFTGLDFDDNGEGSLSDDVPLFAALSSNSSYPVHERIELLSRVRQDASSSVAAKILS